MKVNFNKFKIEWLVWAGLVLSTTFIVLSIFRNTKKESYDQTVHEYREQKDSFFKTSENSPIENKADFKGLNYYAPNPKFKIKAKLLWLPDTAEVKVSRNDGRTEIYKKFVKAEFKLDNKVYQLSLLISPFDSDTSLKAFVPFSDKTNGLETYGGGRYLDIPIKSRNEVIIDFNFAYNPFCVYSYKYSCPLPPEENFLDTHISAGEKTWENNLLEKAN